jgi:hypothetical protein
MMTRENESDDEEQSDINKVDINQKKTDTI